MTPASLRAARQRGDWAVSYLQARFPPLEFPPDVAQRILTHSSWRAGAQTYGHNTRLGFIGRRVMQSYLMLFLQSRLKTRGAEPKQVTDVIDFEELAEKILDTHVLGTIVGEPWQLEDIMRWTDAKNPNDSTGSLSVGMRKVRGATVEAIIGGIFHQFGGVAAKIAFHTRVLPFLVPVMPESLTPSVEEACIQLGGREASLRPGSVDVDTPQRTESPISTWSPPSQPSRRVVST
ncbi:hypothetical protein BS47DRAFT_1293473 [Hydnum rufescens UP504]|uniref:RNase III domain-containing protein n=1 Tax=Hydnum rufescens UP504 TaxID=1448309 RepID=A0A9P6B1E0_9AGAM|nr:hypothetical protein BS47DRAFT_1293473 [Hydnum rufescens UP504]